MKNDEMNNQAQQRQTPQLDHDLKRFEKLIGTWEITGGLRGTNTFE